MRQFIPPLTQGQILQLAVLLEQNRHQEVIRLALPLTRHYPRALPLYNLLSRAYYESGHAGKAIEQLKKAIKIKPDYVHAYSNMGLIHMEMERYELALGCCQQALKLDPQSVEVLNNLGVIYSKLDRNDEAIECYAKAIQVTPNDHEIYYNMGNIYADKGDLEKAEEYYEQAIHISPACYDAHYAYSLIHRYTPDEPHYQELKKIVVTPGLTDKQQVSLHFALGKVEDELAHFDQAFAHFDQANRIRRHLFPYSVDQDRIRFDSIKSAFSGQSGGGSLPHGKSEKRLIFILGMPRSGTSLVEQILSSHADVYGGGEIGVLPRFMQSLKPGGFSLSRRQIEQLRKDYLAGLAVRRISEPIVTDKNNFNFWSIGYIKNAFPNAKIVHVKRNPMATCWSIFRHNFDDVGHAYGYDQMSLSHFYKLYMDLMAFWDSLYPGDIYHLDYEVLTESQEEETRKLLDYCDLAWDEQCLSFHNARRSVTTGSNLQVRKRMYTGSSEVWKRYEKHLMPMIDSLRGGLTDLPRPKPGHHP